VPDCKTHQCVGAMAGAFDAWYQARGRANADLLIETIGGAFGGCVGGMLPDILEPADSSWHRDVGHSVAVGGGVLALRATLAELAQHCRNNAQRRAIQMVTVPATNPLFPAPVDPPTQLLRSLAELFWRLLAGFLNGLSAGYASHLMLDATTPRGIPLLAGRF
jgi:hypothetical protein